jgi:hypothetical protein
LKGGVTYQQLVKLYDYQMQDQEDQWKFHAAIHGIDLDASAKEGETTKGSSSPQEKKFLFKDPAEYEEMTKEEREKETREMMGHWRSFQIRSTPRQ